MLGNVTKSFELIAPPTVTSQAQLGLIVNTDIEWPPLFLTDSGTSNCWQIELVIINYLSHN